MVGVQLECPNCHEHLEIGNSGYEASFGADGTWQVRGGWDLEIVYHECSGGELFTRLPFFGVGAPPVGDDDGSVGVPAPSREPLGDRGSMQREVGDLVDDEEDDYDVERLLAELRAASEQLSEQYLQRGRARLLYQRLEIVRPGKAPVVIERGDRSGIDRLSRLLGRDLLGPRPEA